MGVYLRARRTPDINDKVPIFRLTPRLRRLYVSNLTELRVQQAVCVQGRLRCTRTVPTDFTPSSWWLVLRDLPLLLVMSLSTALCSGGHLKNNTNVARGQALKPLHASAARL